MNKYRVLKSYPKQITNSGRIVTLRKGVGVYLKKEPQVLRLVRMGFLKPVVEMPAKKAKPIKQESKMEVQQEDKEAQNQSMRKSKSEYLNKKNKGKDRDEQSH